MGDTVYAHFSFRWKFDKAFWEVCFIMKFRIKLMNAKDAEEFVRIASSYDYDIK